MAYTGPKFTWHRLASSPETKRGRLDRAVCNQAFHDLFPWITVSSIPMVFSDHLCISVRVQSRDPTLQRHKRKLKFRFEAKWVKMDNFSRVVEENWAENQAPLEEKLAACSLGFIRWSKNLSSISKRLDEIKTSLVALESGQITKETKQRISTIRAEYEMWQEVESVKWKKRAKQHWYKEGDRNTNFFHRIATQRRSVNHITGLRDANHVLRTDDDSIERIILDYFGGLFSISDPLYDFMKHVLNHISPRISNAMKISLDRAYIREEVAKAVKQMHSFKSPGPDSMSPVFFQRFWHIVGDDVTSFVLNFLNHGIFNPTSNYTHIVLIPKTKNPELITQFRPISLCNVIYRIASKVVSNRLRPIIPMAVFDSQSAFVPGRLITYNGCVWLG